MKLQEKFTGNTTTVFGHAANIAAFLKSNSKLATNQSQTAEELPTIQENKEHIRIWKFFTTEQIHIFDSKITG